MTRKVTSFSILYQYNKASNVISTFEMMKVCYDLLVLNVAVMRGMKLC